MSRTRIKFCGLTRRDDALRAVDLGVDALGFVLVARSRRCLAIDAAARIADELPPFVSTVALLMDPSQAEVDALLAHWRPTLLQLHGRESPAFCAGLGHPYLKAVALGGTEDPAATVRTAEDAYPDARALLIDGHAPGGLGGSGRQAPWTGWPEPARLPRILAGGLGPDNVASAIAAARPYAVDVSSGIESAPGVKDPERMRAFVAAVRRADAAVTHA